MHKFLNEFQFLPGSTMTMELFALERLKNQHNSLVAILVPSFLFGSYSFLQVTRTTIKS